MVYTTYKVKDEKPKTNLKCLTQNHWQKVFYFFRVVLIVSEKGILLFFATKEEFGLGVKRKQAMKAKKKIEVGCG